MKRMILMLTLAAMLVVALTVTAAPSFAKPCGHQGNGHPQCNTGGSGGGPNKPPGQTNNPNPGK